MVFWEVTTSGGSLIKNGNAAGKGEVTGDMIKNVDDKELNWIWKLCNMAFENELCLNNGGQL